jgi:dTDP-4-dehydrorhamnose reductase
MTANRRIVVLGAGGQLGRDLSSRLSGEVIALPRERAELTQAETLRTSLTELGPDVVVNCAAYNFVDRAEGEPQVAFAVNAWGTGALATICRDLDCTLVHFSTDHVFGLDTSRTQPYAEDDAPGPVNFYGLSKLAGEYLVRMRCPKHAIIRTCGLYGVWGSGGKGGNFVETMLRLAAQEKPLRVVADQVCTPSYTVDVALATAELLTTACHGIYHVTNSGSCTWYEFARTVFELAGVPASLTPISSAEYGAAARRPAYSVLASRLPPLRPWHEALAAYLTERKRNPV